LRLLSVSDGGASAPTPGEGGNLQGVALTCVGDGELEWHLGVAESGELRVVEMRNPQRLVVDLRRPGAGGS
jgi:hypothetical protein